MDKEKEIDMQHFASMVTKAQEKAIRKLIEANTIVIDNRFRYVKPFIAVLEQSAICFPPMIMGMEIKFADLPNNADFLLFEADKTDYERKVQEIREQAVKEFAEELKKEINDLSKDILTWSLRRQAPELIDLVYNKLYGDCDVCPDNNAEYNERTCPKKGECGK